MARVYDVFDDYYPHPMPLDAEEQLPEPEALESAGSAESGAHAIVLAPPPAMGAACGHGSGLRVTFENVRYTVAHSSKKGSKLQLLRGLTGEFDPGQMCAIVGPSGCGKTTFLDLLAGRKTQGQLTGSIYYGASKPSRQLLRRYVGYVEQQDTLVDTLTVFEMLMYTAALKRPRTEGRAAKLAAAEALIGKLALEICRDTRIGSALKRGISGGQAKRTNIAIALITDARVLLLDEPTSGLDSFTSNEVMQTVKALCKDGTTIATTIHSPTSYTFGLFDRLMVMLAGRVVYFGTTQRAMLDYFVGHCGARQPTVGDNLVEWLMDFAITQERQGAADALADVYDNSGLAKAAALAVESTIWAERERLERSVSLRSVHMASLAGAKEGWLAAATGSGAYVTPAWWTLGSLMWHRTSRNYRSWSYVLPRVFDKLAFAITVVILYWGIGNDFAIGNVPNVAALLYLCMSNPAWSAVNFGSHVLNDRTLYIREQHDGMYRPTVYIAWKMLDELTLQLLVSWGVNAMIFYGCQLQGSFLFFHLGMFTMTMNAISLGYAIAGVSPSTDVATPATASVLTLMLILSGFMIKESSIPIFLRWFVKVNLMHYMWGGMMINQFENGSGIIASVGGTKVLNYYGLNGASKWNLLGAAYGSFAFWSIMAWAALSFVRVHRR
ncbi:hypothetical protein Rsub_01085 [Raphidocelis subcapitata]|uniref:ABC transporter domain-containing protein n=1 Tax=Raphidocelis subcapitata TaxID=307507 RepID=A0A2V0NS47_9CHLO|nr:hypothetical protein Rsub_01085 [Raphidocelis subcapitata]|eukprot:GBF88373.1 hypothetical protein Rsub_01085 [Raphidocelis subcapitata]